MGLSEEEGYTCYHTCTISTNLVLDPKSLICYLPHIPLVFFPGWRSMSPSWVVILGPEGVRVGIQGGGGVGVISDKQTTPPPLSQQQKDTG